MQKHTPGVVSRPLHPSTASVSRSSSARLANSVVESREGNASLSRSSSARLPGARGKRRERPPSHKEAVQAPWGTETDLLPGQPRQGAFDEKVGTTSWSKQKRKHKRHFKVNLCTRAVADNTIYNKEESDSSEEEFMESYTGLAGLPTWLSREERRAAQLKQLKQQSAEAACLREMIPETTLTPQGSINPMLAGKQTREATTAPINPMARLYQSSVGSLVFGGTPNESIDNSLYDGCFGLPTWAGKQPRNKKRPDYLQMETIQREPRQPKKDFSKAPNVKSVVDVVAFGRDVDFEGETPWSSDFTEMYDGRPGLATWAPEHDRGVRHVSHPSNHWTSESDPWRGTVPRALKYRPESATAGRSHQSHPPDMKVFSESALEGYAGLSSWEETRCTYHHGLRKIFPPPAFEARLDEFCDMEECLRDHHRRELYDSLRDLPREELLHKLAGSRSWENRAKKDLEPKSRTRQARSNPPRQGNLSGSQSVGSARTLMRNRSVSPRFTQAWAGG